MVMNPASNPRAASGASGLLCRSAPLAQVAHAREHQREEQSTVTAPP